jgi:hypothetical protein
MVALDPVRFDTLAISLSTSGTRRGFGRLLAALPLAAGLASWCTPAAVQGSDSGSIVGGGGSRRRRRKARQRHDPGDDKLNRKGKRTGKRTDRQPNAAPVPDCSPNPEIVTWAGRCGPVPNNCGQPVDCGSCSDVCDVIDLDAPACPAGCPDFGLTVCALSPSDSHSCECVGNWCREDGPPSDVSTACCSCAPL